MTGDSKREYASRNARICDMIRSGAQRKDVAALFEITETRVQQILNGTPPSLEPKFGNRAVTA